MLIKHFIRDYLHEEFAIVSKKIRPLRGYRDEKIPERDYWISKWIATPPTM
jgi:hypothetical protein